MRQHAKNKRKPFNISSGALFMKVLVVNFHYLVDFYYSCQMCQSLTSFPVTLRLRGQILYMAERRLKDESC